MESFSILPILIISFVEGVTEFIPVSSTAHMMIAEYFIPYISDTGAGKTFIIFIQLGAISGALFLYPEQFRQLIPAPGKFRKQLTALKGFSYPVMAAAVLPVLLAGFLFYKPVRETLLNVHTVSVTLIIGGAVMILAERLTHPDTESSERITFRQALTIGVFQCLSLIPGMSRSGSCMIGGLIAGVRLKPAADFSFIIAVPVMTAAVGYEMLKSYSRLSASDVPAFAAGFVLSFLFAFLSMKFFIRILPKVSLLPFAVYRVIAGVVMLIILS